MYIFAVALEDGTWHHVDSYLPERRNRASTIKLWQNIATREDPEWTERYHANDPNKKAFGGRVEVLLKNGSRIEDEMTVANAHPLGTSPFRRDDYLQKFKVLTDGVITHQESDRFIEAATNAAELAPGELHELNVALPAGALQQGKRGIF
jgi:2-methylcitrate dehydratase